MATKRSRWSLPRAVQHLGVSSEVDAGSLAPRALPLCPGLECDVHRRIYDPGGDRLHRVEWQLRFEPTDCGQAGHDRIQLGARLRGPQIAVSPDNVAAGDAVHPVRQDVPGDPLGVTGLHRAEHNDFGAQQMGCHDVAHEARDPESGPLRHHVHVRPGHSRRNRVGQGNQVERETEPGEQAWPLPKRVLQPRRRVRQRRHSPGEGVGIFAVPVRRGMQDNSACAGATYQLSWMQRCQLRKKRLIALSRGNVRCAVNAGLL
jgi:hypothetical protein